MTVQMCAGSVWDNRRAWPCARKGKNQEGGKWWCYHHAPSLVAKRREERNETLRAADALVARQRRMAQCAEAVRIVQAYIDYRPTSRDWSPEGFAAYLYPEPKEAE